MVRFRVRYVVAVVVPVDQPFSLGGGAKAAGGPPRRGRKRKAEEAPAAGTTRSAQAARLGDDPSAGAAAARRWARRYLGRDPNYSGFSAEAQQLLQQGVQAAVGQDKKGNKGKRKRKRDPPSLPHLRGVDGYKVLQRIRSKIPEVFGDLAVATMGQFVQVTRFDAESGLLVVRVDRNHAKDCKALLANLHSLGPKSVDIHVVHVAGSLAQLERALAGLEPFL